MKKNILILILFIMTATVVKAIEPKVIRGHDSTYRTDRATTTHRRSSRNSTEDDILLSTIEASSEISVQITSAVSLEASTQATSEEPQHQRRGRRYSQLKFLKNNKVQIKQNIAQGSGEHLSTLLNMMSIKKTPSTLAKIQSNFDVLASLDDEAFLSKLGEIINS